MVDSINPPSFDHANQETLLGAFSSFEQDLRLRLHNMLPAKVVSYDRTLNRAIVQPMIQYIDTSNIAHTRAEVGEIPVQLDGGGNFFVSFPLVPGNLGWIKANDRDISLFLQSYAIAPPNDFRLQDFSSAVFVPDIMFGYTIEAGDEDAMVIQSLDGTIKITLSPDVIRIKHPTLIELEAPDLNFIGDIAHTGLQISTGEIHSDTEVSAKTVILTTHTHTQPNTTENATVQGNTGAPIP
jgi:hypothetical protein